LADNVAEKTDDVEEGRLAAGVWSDQCGEAIDRLIAGLQTAETSCLNTGKHGIPRG
jgi:hypothetical protein